MKKIILSIGVLMSLFSCSDYLEEDLKSNVEVDTYYRTTEGFNSLVNVNYSMLRDIYGDQPWLFCAGTDLYVEGRNAEPIELSRYKLLNPAAFGVDHLYSKCYESITKVNLALKYSKLTVQTSDLANRVSELRFIRANDYFLLVQTYGGVPLVKEYPDGLVLSYDRNEAKDVYSFIISELEGIVNNISSSTFSGRVNKKAVQDLLAKVYLTRGWETYGEGNADFTKAAAYAEDTIGGKGLTLSPEELWLPGNDINAETIFSVQFSGTSVSIDPQNLGNAQGSFFGAYQGGAIVAGKAPFKTYTLCPSAFLIGLYEKGDKRWNSTFMTEIYTRYYDYYDVAPADRAKLTVAHYYAPKWETTAERDAYLLAHPNLTNTGTASARTYHAYGTYSPSATLIPSADIQTICIKKFDDPTAPYATQAPPRVSTRDFVVSRLAETYMVAAEAYIKLGNTAEALKKINAVRARAGVANATATDMNIDYLLDEKAREFAGEYNRWFDLKRTGTLVDRCVKYNHFITSADNFVGNNGALKILRPIPQSAIDANRNKKFPQNPAYQ